MRTLYIQSPHSLSVLAESCFALTPKVTLCGLHHLYLDIQPTLRALGGENTIWSHAEHLTETFASSYQMILVDRPEWARALVQKTPERIPTGKSAARLKLLPIEKLFFIGDPLTENAAEKKRLIVFLKKVGMRTIGDFIAIPTASILRRFGKEGESLHLYAKGNTSLCLPLYAPQDLIETFIDADEFFSLDALLFSLRQALIRIEARLRGRALSARSIQLTFHLESHPPIAKTLPLNEPLQEAQAILRILKEFLQNLHWESPLVRLHLKIIETAPHTPGQLSLLDDFENKSHSLAHYVARLRARLGEDRAGFALLHSSHLPEQSFSLSWPARSACDHRDPFPERPLFLFSPPRPFSLSPLWKLEPTESLFTQWWESGGTREYFTARKESECLWVYRTPSGEWFAHGVF